MAKQTIMTTSSPVLDMEEQFRHDLAFIPPQPTHEEEAILVEGARQGDEEARRLLVLSCTWYIYRQSARYARIAQETGKWRVEFFDLFQEAHLTVLERLNKALAHPNPCGYLRKAIDGALIDYCGIHAGPMTPKRNGGKYEHPYATVSLDQPVRQLAHGGTQYLGDILPAPEPLPENTHDFTPLHEAMNSLSETQREIIDGYFGFGAQESVFEITIRQRQRKGLPTEGYTANSPIGWNNYRRAIVKLRKRLQLAYAS
jgi:DNA-directed RNA polymerase specialized sigma24 family protein